MVKIDNQAGEFKTGKQGEAVYQGFYGRQIRRVLSKKSIPPTKPQTQQRQRFQAGLAWRAGLSHDARIFLDGYCISHRVIDTLGVPLTWDKLALKIALEKPTVAVLD
jgi:hypothetical protein